MSDNARKDYMMRKIGETEVKVDAIAAQMAAARTSNWEAAAVVRVLWDDLAERVGREEADRRLRAVFDGMGIEWTEEMAQG